MTNSSMGLPYAKVPGPAHASGRRVAWRVARGKGGQQRVEPDPRAFRRCEVVCESFITKVPPRDGGGGECVEGSFGSVGLSFLRLATGWSSVTLPRRRVQRVGGVHGFESVNETSVRQTHWHILSPGQPVGRCLRPERHAGRALARQRWPVATQQSAPSAGTAAQE